LGALKNLPINKSRRYVCITNNLERLVAEHLGQKGIFIDVIPGFSNLSRPDVHAVEQALIEFHGLGKNGGTLLNKINSTSQNNLAYAEPLTRGSGMVRAKKKSVACLKSKNTFLYEVFGMTLC